MNLEANAFNEVLVRNSTISIFVEKFENNIGLLLLQGKSPMFEEEN